MLKPHDVLCCAVAASVALYAGLTAAAALTVTVTNVATEDGQVRIAVYDEETWLDTERRVAREFVAPLSATVSATFELSPGTYAVAVLHDVNGNGRMDYGFMRMPKEPYGFSNGVVPRFGPPKFDDSAFAVADDDVDITIELRE